MKNKNKKISRGLKRHYENKRKQTTVKKGLAIAIPFILAICLISEMSEKTNAHISDFKTSEIANSVFIPKEDKNSVVIANIENKEELSVKDTKGKIKAVAVRECRNRNLGGYCVEDMLAMAWTESRFDCNVVGDNGNSFGCFQIHRGYHKHVTVEQARDIEFSLNWTLNRLVSKGYPKYRTASIRLHNGSLDNPKTLAYFNTVERYIDRLRQ